MVRSKLTGKDCSRVDVRWAESFALLGWKFLPEGLLRWAVQLARLFFFLQARVFLPPAWQIQPRIHEFNGPLRRRRRPEAARQRRPRGLELPPPPRASAVTSSDDHARTTVTGSTSAVEPEPDHLQLGFLTSLCNQAISAVDP
jgi:hypothetical protein